MARSRQTLPEPRSTGEVALRARDLATTLRERPLLRGLLPAAAGFTSGKVGSAPGTTGTEPTAALIYCVKGAGWCKAAGRLFALRKGDLLVLRGAAYSCGPHASSGWAAHWLRAIGCHLPDYLDELSTGQPGRLLRVGADPQLLRLFMEVSRALARGTAFANLLHASHALGYLLSLLIHKCQDGELEGGGTVEKVAEAIIFMSEHLDEPVRVSALARLASLSPDYFARLFKDQTGCSPRDYLHLLRIHRACELLEGTNLRVKQVASRLGYEDPFHFSRTFKAFQGLSPVQYRDACAR